MRFDTLESCQHVYWLDVAYGTDRNGLQLFQEPKSLFSSSAGSLFPFHFVYVFLGEVFKAVGSIEIRSQLLALARRQGIGASVQCFSGCVAAMTRLSQPDFRIAPEGQALLLSEKPILLPPELRSIWMDFEV